MKACSSIGEAMELGQSLKLTWVPDAPENLEEMEDEGLEPGDPYDWSQTGAVADGDWPPMPTALSLAVFGKDDSEARGLIFGEPWGRRSSTQRSMVNTWRSQERGRRRSSQSSTA